MWTGSSARAGDLSELCEPNIIMLDPQTASYVTGKPTPKYVLTFLPHGRYMITRYRRVERDINTHTKFLGRLQGVIHSHVGQVEARPQHAHERNQLPDSSASV